MGEQETQTGLSSRFTDIPITTASVLLWSVVVFYAYSQSMPRAQYGILFLGSVLIIYIASELEKEWVDKQWHQLIFLLLSGAIVLGTSYYLYTNFSILNNVRVGYALEYEYRIAIAFMLAIIYLTWRSFGTTFVIIIVGGIAYGYFGDGLTGVFGHGGLSINRLLLVLVLDITGFYGFLTQLTAAWIALFLLYAGLLQAYGAYDIIFRAAAFSNRYISSGIAQTAVIASTIIGSINGSQTANASMTGSFTIPLMKRNGIRPETAGGIEAVASTSGQVLPPVMGAGAFVMASLLGISYVSVLIAGLIPAVILVITIVAAVHYTSVPQLNDTQMDDMVEGKLTRAEKISEGFKLGIPFVILVYVLGVLQYTVMTAALYTVISMVITGITFPIVAQAIETGDYNLVLAQMKESVHETLEGLRIGALATAPIAIIMSAINGVVDILMTTGVPGAISLAMIALSGGILIVAAILGVIICILMGLGMPTTAAYTVVALLVAPTMIADFGVPALAAHYFVFYAAILAGLTPPIATTAAVAAGIANAGFWRTCFEAVKISAPLFILPFVFVYHPSIVSASITVGTLIISLFVLVGAVSMIFGINREFNFDRSTKYLFRMSFIIVGIFTMVHTNMYVRLGGLIVIIGLFVLTRYFDPIKLGTNEKIITNS